MTAAPVPTLVPIEQLNALPPDQLAHALKPLFEAARPLAEALATRRPFASYQELLQAARAVSAELDEPDRIEVINAHPRIGENAAQVRATSALSYREQGYEAEAGMSLSETQRLYADLASLNAAYEQKFGFRFVVFVNGRPKAVIAEIMRQRFANDRPREMATALEDMVLIAGDRLRKLTP
ncbi:MAG: 2-oxo-4-hydroxy-4-carboxy-5-ureidoimidazoline decarboxylase [Chloroflexota bacterium]